MFRSQGIVGLQPPADQLSVRLSDKDRTRLRKIRQEIAGIETDAEALLWALRHVVVPETTTEVILGTYGGGPIGGGKAGYDGSIAAWIPTVPLDDTHLAGHPIEFHLDTTILSPITSKYGKRIQIPSAELTRLRSIESQFLAFAEKARVIVDSE